MTITNENLFQGPRISADGKYYQAEEGGPWLPTSSAHSDGRDGPNPSKSRTTYVLLALFLGGFGVHNFYAGRTGVAIAQLLFTILFFGVGSVVLLGLPLFFLPVMWIWVIVECFAITEDGDGKRFA